MGFAFYELSGGNEFVPIADEKRAALEEKRVEKERLLAEAKAEQLEKQPAPVIDTQVTLASAVITPAAEQSSEAVNTDDVTAALTDALDTDKAEEVTEEVAAVIEPVAPPADIREVTSARVNMRAGPGQRFDIVAKLTNGEEVEILQDPGDGWVKLRVAESGRVGWMADFLLTAANN